ncbi:MAG: sodium:solute symporter family protein, partial [bacterium]|nr:sodium:solute symporter family protein [bacterium]
VQTGEEVLQPCTLPEGAPTVDRPMLLTAGGLEIPMPSRTSVIGFVTVWLLVGGIIGAFVWIVS